MAEPTDPLAYELHDLRRRLEQLTRQADAARVLADETALCHSPHAVLDRLHRLLVAAGIPATATVLVGPQHGAANAALPVQIVAAAGTVPASFCWGYDVPALVQALDGRPLTVADAALAAPGRPLPMAGEALCPSLMLVGLPGPAARRWAVAVLGEGHARFDECHLSMIQALQIPLAARLEVLSEQEAWRGLLRAQSRTLAASEARFRDHALAAADFLWEADESMALRHDGADITPGGAERFGIAEGFRRIPAAVDASLRTALLDLPDVEARRPFRDVSLHLPAPGAGPDGETCWISLSGRPIFDAEGSFQGWRGVGRDVTDEVAQRERSEVQRQEAEQAMRARSSFLAVIGHELRTPIAALIGTLTLQQEAEHGPRSRELGRIALRNAEEMLVLLTDLLDMSRMEAGRLPLQAQPFELSELADATLGMVQAQAHAKGLTLTRALALPTPCYLRGDPGRLRQMLLNFLSNAIKFTREGGVSLRVSAPGETPGSGSLLLRFAVEDTGAGLSEEQQRHLFLPFNQLGAMESRSMGTGLGLAITRRLAEMMDGTVGVDSRPGRGSVFRFEVTLPMAAASELQRQDEAPPEPMRNARVLLVEDNPTNRMIGQTLLASLGAEVTVADDGRRALALAADNRFDLILMDIAMPDMDGVAATRAIRDLDSHGAAVPIIALTANTRQEDAAEYLASGFNAVMTKPLRRPQLMALLQRYAGACDVAAAE